MGAMSKKDAKAEVGGFWSYIFGNESIKEKPIDLSKFIELDEIKASNLLKSLQEIEIASKTNTSVWQEYFSTLSDGQKWQIEFVKNNDLQKTSTEDLVKANQQARASALAHNEAIKAQTFSAKAGKVALQALATVGNMFVMWAFTKGIELAVKVLDNYIHRLDNAKEALSSTQSELSFVNDELKDTTDKIAELEALDPSSISITDKEDLQRLKDQNEELRIRQKYLEDQEKYDLQKVADLTKEKYGQKYGNVNRDTVDEYRSLYANKNTKTVPASSYLTGGAYSQSTPYAASKQNTGAIGGSGTLSDLIAQYEHYIELKKEAVQNNDADGIKQYNDKLVEIAEKLRSDRTELQGFSDDLKAAGDTSGELDNITWQLKTIDDLLLSPGQNLVNFIDKDILSEDKQKLVDLANAGKLTQDELSSNFSEVDKYLKENGLTLDDLISVVKTYKEELYNVSVDETTISPLSISQTVDQLNTQLKPAFDSLKSAYQDIFTDDGFTPENVDIPMLDSIRASIEELNSMEGVDIDIDYSSFENLAEVLTDTASTEDKVHEAINSLATDIVSALNPAISECSGEAYQMVQALLESVGVMNSEEVMVSALGYTYEEYVAAKEAASSAGIDLANATAEDIVNFANEATAAEEDKTALLNYYQYKIIASGATIDTLGDINALIAEYNQLGINCNKLKEYLALKGAGAGSGVDVKYRGYGSSTKGYDTGVSYSPTEVDFKPKSEPKKSGGGGGTGRAKKEEFDWIETKIKNLEEDISRLDKTSDSSYSSVSEKNKALADGIEKINEEINLQQQAYERYMAKAESVGLSDEYKNLVQNGAVDIESITDDDLKEAIKNYEQWYGKAKETQDKINDLYDDAKDKHVAAYELEASEIEKLRDNQTITEREYLDAMLALYEKYYADQTEFANQAKEAKLKYLKEEKDYLETVANAAASLLDDQIDYIEKEKDREHKKYEDQIAEIEDIIKAKEKDADAVQDQIDAIKDENDELDRQKNLREALRKEQEAQTALERAKNQRTKLLYKNGQMVWDVDDSAIREANKNVEDAQDAVDKAKKDIIIANLQIQIDAIQDGIDALEDQKAQLEVLADESDAFFDKKIADMREYQNEWKEALEIEERAIDITNLKSMFGEDAVDEILGHNLTLLSTWKQNYADTMAAMDLAGSDMVGSITSEWEELAGVSNNMEDAIARSQLSMDSLTGMAGTLDNAVGNVEDASNRVADVVNNTDMSPVNEQLGNTEHAAQNTQEQLNGIVEKLDTLESDVQNYQIPAIDTVAFAASLGTGEGTDGILGQLNTFIERFREICSSIPSIWDSTIQSLNGQGTVPGESAGYDSMFAPLLNAMDGTKLEIDGKLKEYAESWTGFNETLGEIIGVGSGSSIGGAEEHQSSGTGMSSTKSGSGSQKTDKDVSSDSIVGTIESGGEAVIQSFDEVWIPGFEEFASQIDEICMNVCAMVEDMANEVIKMVNDALKAMKELEAKNTGAYKIDKVGSSYSPHAVSPANAFGTLSSADGSGAVTKDQISLVNELGNEMLIRDGILHEIPGGAHTIQLQKGDIILNHKQTEELKKYNRVTSGGGHGKLVGSFASGTVTSSKVSILDSNIRDMWSSDEFRKLLENVKKLRDGQSIIIGQNNTILKDKNGDPYREGTVITPKGDVYMPLPDTHPTMQLQKKFDAYVQKMGGADFLGANAMIEHNKQMNKWTKQITNSNIINNVVNNRPEISIGDINVTCPGITSQEVMREVGDALNKQIGHLSQRALQEAMMR